ncbi:TusE/DsrC/DsvC family sulfur relay protein [Buchnera aphidicola]|uniref:Sulfurtransferase n=1 Tax=Buchnera aphidicola (Therioaphis trifolii) TaxID=1241884 RepID=A0A4D6YBG1_9GAMM|nr:TusE/DsrC/DsvC family sulfur relay protein [Buchnera aphidicola]QCI27287.1 TusE/DsrC/DsvC family sulfur relay protein [Buchnera aphidicola (Therioaphis trifolii)]
MNKKKKNTKIWNIKLAKQIAKKESIILTIEHLEIIYFIRDIYNKYKIIPPNRMLLKLMKKKFEKKKCNNIYILSLFPKGINKQANKIAGLPKSNICL